MRKYLTLLVLWVVSALTAQASDENTAHEDSSRFIIASLLTATPADAVYSGFGHSIIRMQCPSEKLDYCFTFELDISNEKLAEYFTGQAKAALVAVETPEFLKVYGAEGRGVVERELNLSLHEKQQLWKNLDTELTKPPHLEFNFLTSNCVTATLLMIESGLIAERLEWGTLPDILTHDNGDVLRHHCGGDHWNEFLFMTFFGSSSDGHYPTEMKLSPTMLAETLASAKIVGDSTARPVFSTPAHTLLKATHIPTPSPISPMVVFGLLLAIILIITVLEWVCGMKKLAKTTDIILLALQTIAGLVLIYTSYIGNIFGTHWNWYLIPANPLPVILWLAFHKNRQFHNIYLFYTIILALFVCLTPLLSQLDIEHQLITAALAVRCASNYYRQITQYRI